MFDHRQPLTGRFASLPEQLMIAAAGALGGLSFLLNLCSISLP